MKLSDAAMRIAAAVSFAGENAAVDGGHHKQWVIDQMLRILLAEHYEEWVKTYNVFSGDDYAPWDAGIAP